jgi:GNAT superfamily N-acetyltransferase
MKLKGEPAAFTIRAIEPGDGEGLARFYEGLSPESHHARFHGASPRLAPAACAYFCRPDHGCREGLVAQTVGAGGRPENDGHLCLEPVEPGVLEMANADADAWQRRGVGRALLAAAIGWGRSHGIGSLTASMLCGNAAVLALVRSTGLPVAYGPGDRGTVDVQIRIGDALPSAA